MKYVVHCMREPFDIYIGRGSFWGNPFSHLTKSNAIYKVGTREEAIEKYMEWLLDNPNVLKRVPMLKDKVLGCYCDPLPCHGHILSKLANDNY